MIEASNLKRLLRFRFAIVRRDLDEVLKNLTDHLLSWAPREGMKTVEALLFEIVAKEIELMAWAKAGGHGEWKEIEGFDGREATLEGLTSILQETRQETLDYVDSLSDAELQAPILFPEDWWEGLGLPELTMHEVFRNIAAHEWYHTGQLVSYLWMHGYDPNKP